MKRRLNGEGTVYEERDPRRRTTHRAEADVTLPNGIMRRVIARGHSATDARAKLEKKIRRVKESSPEAERLTLGVFLDQWLAHKERSVRASTLAAYTRDVGHLRKHLGGVRLSRLTARDVEAAIAVISRPHAAQADKCRRTLKQALRQAVRWELLSRSPAEHIEPVRQPETVRGVLTPAQVVLLLDAMRGQAYYGIVALAIHSGLRLGELLALRWRDVTADSVRVTRTVSEGAPGGYAPPKTRAGVRTVPVPEAVITALGARGKKDELVFRTGAGTPMSQRNVKRALDAGIVKANKEVDRMKELGEGLSLEPLPDLRVHDLRRTYATMLAARGVHPRVIQRLLGQSTQATWLIYTDVLAEQVEAARLPAVGV